MTVDLAGAGAERSQSNSELLMALAASVDRNERVQEKFRIAVVRRLARLEARARLLQLSSIVDWLPGGPGDEVAKREAGCEAMVAEDLKISKRNSFRRVRPPNDRVRWLAVPGSAVGPSRTGQ
jgi:hypothetical protein